MNKYVIASKGKKKSMSKPAKDYKNILPMALKKGGK